jgi:hypothetical protein
MASSMRAPGSDVGSLKEDVDVSDMVKAPAQDVDEATVESDIMSMSRAVGGLDSDMMGRFTLKSFIHQRTPP